MKKLILTSAVLAAAALSGCGGSTSYSSQTPAPPMDTGPKVDAFYAEVGKAAGNKPEDTEAASVDAVMLTMPDDTEPVSL